MFRPFGYRTHPLTECLLYHLNSLIFCDLPTVIKKSHILELEKLRSLSKLDLLVPFSGKIALEQIDIFTKMLLMICVCSRLIYLKMPRRVGWTGCKLSIYRCENLCFETIRGGSKTILGKLNTIPIPNVLMFRFRMVLFLIGRSEVKRLDFEWWLACVVECKDVRLHILMSMGCHL